MINKKTGFTLIELLVVIAIIGILSAVVLASLNTSREKARDANKVSDIKQVALAMEIERNQITGSYTVTQSTMPTTIGTTLPNVPSNNSDDSSEYTWVDNTSTSSAYCVYATLENGSPCGGVTPCYYSSDATGSNYYSTAVPTLTSCK